MGDGRVHKSAPAAPPSQTTVYTTRPRRSSRGWAEWIGSAPEHPLKLPLFTTVHPIVACWVRGWSGCRNRVSARAGQRCRRSAPAPWYKGWRICAPAGACSCSCSLLLLLLFPSSFSSNPSVVTIQPPVARAFRNTVCLAHAAGPRSWSAAPVWVPNFRVYTARGSPRRDGG